MTIRFTSSDIKPFLKKARRIVRLPECDILVSLSSQGTGRLLIITARRVGNAPERNTIRRRFKAVFQKLHFSAKPYNWGIIIKPAGTHLTSSAIELLLLAAHETVRASPISNEHQ